MVWSSVCRMPLCSTCICSHPLKTTGLKPVTPTETLTWTLSVETVEDRQGSAAKPTDTSNSNAGQYVKWHSVVSPEPGFAWIWIGQRLNKPPSARGRALGNDTWKRCLSWWADESWLYFTDDGECLFCSFSYLRGSVNRKLTFQVFTVNKRWYNWFHFGPGSIVVPHVDRGATCKIWGKRKSCQS